MCIFTLDKEEDCDRTKMIVFFFFLKQTHTRERKNKLFWLNYSILVKFSPPIWRDLVKKTLTPSFSLLFWVFFLIHQIMESITFSPTFPPKISILFIFTRSRRKSWIKNWNYMINYDLSFPHSQDLSMQVVL